MNINWKRQRGVLGNLIVFAIGCLAVVVPFFIRASIDSADETARQEQTMGPGITMFMGMIVAPLGGVVTGRPYIHRRYRHHPSSCELEKPRQRAHRASREALLDQ